MRANQGIVEPGNGTVGDRFFVGRTPEQADGHSQAPLPRSGRANLASTTAADADAERPRWKA